MPKKVKPQSRTAKKPAAEMKRVDRARVKFSDKAKSELVGLIERPWRAQVEAFVENADLALTPRAPFDSFLEADAEAKSAWMELKRRKLKALESRLKASAGSRTFGGPEPAHGGRRLLGNLTFAGGTTYDLQVARNGKQFNMLQTTPGSVVQGTAHRGSRAVR